MEQMRSSALSALVFFLFLSVPCRSQAVSVHTIVQTDGWSIYDVAINNRGTVVVSGGGEGGADGLVLATGGKLTKFAARGDAVPGVEGSVFTLFHPKIGSGVYGGLYGPSDRAFSLNDRDEVAFPAFYSTCLDSGVCPRRGGLFLCSRDGIRRIALERDVPPRRSTQNAGFNRVWLNNQGMVLFDVTLLVDSMPGFQDVRRSLILYANGTLEQVVSGSGSASFFRVLAFADDGTVTLFQSPTLGDMVTGIFRYVRGERSKIVAVGDSLPGAGVISEITDAAASKSGHVVFRARFGDVSNQAMFLVGRDGGVTRIVASGDSTPIGGTYAFRWNHYSTTFKPAVNNVGSVLFAAPVQDNLNRIGAAVFLYRQGRISKVVADLDPVPGDQSRRIPLPVISPPGSFPSVDADFVLNDQDMAGLRLSDLGLFLFTDGVVRPTDQPLHQLTTYFQPNPVGRVYGVNEAGEMVFRTDTGVFVGSPASVAVPNPSFEVPGNALPDGWETTWNNSGNGTAARFECGPDAALTGSSVLRLYIPPGGGSTFVLSDPLAVSPDTSVHISAWFRYYLENSSDAVYFTVIELNAAGNIVGFSETTGVAGENFWNWQLKSLSLRTAPDAAYLRIRVGLTASDSYLDVDEVRISGIN